MLLKEFFAAVFSTWVEKVGIILTILPFIERIPRIKAWLKGEPVLERFRRLLWVIGVICIVWGFYSAWKDQHEIAQSTQQKLEELTKPNLVFTPIQIMSGETNAGLEVFIEATIKNLGAPSAVTGFQLRAEGPNFDTGRMNSFFIPEGHKITKEGGAKVAEFHSQMFLQEKAAHAIQRGDLVGGWIRFILPITSSQLKSGKTTLSIYFNDINDKEYSYRSDKLPPQQATYSPATGASPFIFPSNEVSPKP